MVKPNQQLLRDLALLDSASSEEFDRLTRIVCRLLDVPVSLVSIIDVERQVFLSAQGLSEPWRTQMETPLSHSFCQHVVADNQPLVLEDARGDERLCTNLAIQELDVIAYLGIPLRTPDNVVIGSLCAIDHKPRKWATEDVDVLRDLADIASSEIALRYFQNTTTKSEQAVQLQSRMLDVVQQAVVAMNKDGTIIYWNKFAQELYGWSSTEAKGLHITSIVSAPDAQVRSSEIMTKLNQGESWSGEYMVRRRDGHEFYAYVVDSPIMEQDGELAGVVEVSFDISGRKATEADLEESLHRLNMALDAGNMSAWEWDMQTDEVTFNEQSYSLWGLDSSKTYHADKVFNRISPEDLPTVKEEVEKAIANQDLYDHEFRITLPDGSIRWLAGKGEVIFGEDEQPLRMFGVTHDVTESVAGQQALQDQERLLRKLIDNLFTFVGLLNREGELIEANQTALGAANLDASDVLHKPFEETYWWSYSPEVQSELRDAINRCVRGESLRYDVQVRVAQDRLITIDFMLAPVYDEDGNVTHIIPSGLDIEKRKQMEEQLRNNAAKLKQLTETLEQRVAERTTELERSNRELQEFAYVASHDLQEPLRKILAFSDRLSSRFSDDLDEQAHDYLSRMQNAAGRMQTLINDLLTLSRVTTRGKPFVEVDMNEIVGEVIDDLETSIDEAGGSVTADDLPPIEADASQIARLFMNLIGNSLRFRQADKPPHIKISGEVVTNADTQDRCVRISVTDNGIGFDEKYLDRIFIPFQRLHGRKKYDGTGMGLAICRSIVERHSGSITATSKLNEGATFIITLPAQQNRPEYQNKDVEPS